MGRWAIYTANAVLVAFSCFLAANIFNQWMAETIAPPAKAPAVAPPQSDDPARPQGRHQVILDRNLFKSRVIETPVAAATQPDEALDATKLPLRLLGTAAATDATRSTAALENTSNRKSQVVKVGEAVKDLSNVKVVRIERKRIVLDNDGKREELKLEEEVANAIRSRPQVARRAPDDRTAALAARLQKMKDNQEDRRSPSALFSQGRILPKYENGQMVGIQIDNIQPGGFYDQIGLTDGTVVSSINGIKIDSPSATKDILRALTEDDTLEIERQGDTPLTVKTSDIPIAVE